jgi:hypothetical protein
MGLTAGRKPQRTQVAVVVCSAVCFGEGSVYEFEATWLPTSDSELDWKNQTLTGCDTFSEDERQISFA